MNVLKARPGLFFIAAIVLMILSIPLLQGSKYFIKPHLWSSPMERTTSVYAGRLADYSFRNHDGMGW